jgi:hypothetical protein
MNPTLKDIVKEELQRLLNVNFIYPISDSNWVSPLVIVPKKNNKWRICVDFIELNKDAFRDYFPFPFIYQVLDTLSRKKCFSFLDGFMVITRSKLHERIRKRPLLLSPGVLIIIGFFPLSYVIPMPPFNALSWLLFLI